MNDRSHSDTPDLNTSPTFDEGMIWEGVVVDELSKAGFQIVARNVRLGQKEADIIAIEGDTLCVVEVKSRNNAAYLRDIDALINRQKRRDMVAIGNYYFKVHKDMGFRKLRFDFALVLIPRHGEEPRIDYYRNAFLPTVGRTF